MHRNLFKKSVNSNECQEVRRRKMLEEQRKSRLTLQDKNRDLEALVSVARLNMRGSASRRKFKPRCFHDIYHTDHSLQQSEWLRQRPENLADWILVACPKGQRVMVVACNGRTDMFNKRGRLQIHFRSMLPGDGEVRNAITMLDCIYVKNLNAFYVLDALAFGNQDLVDCDAEFRFFWLKAKLEELNLAEITRGNDMKFITLDHYEFENSVKVSVAFQSYPLWSDNNPELDGFLFYHKEGNYSYGTTPLVGWLFPFMIPEVLGYQVSSQYERPDGYVDCQSFIEIFEKNLLKKRYKNQLKPTEMEFMEEVQREDDEDGETVSLRSTLAAEKMLELEDDCYEESECVENSNTFS